MGAARSLGNVSLTVAVGGLAAAELALHQGWVSGSAWEVCAQAFLAATIGGLADWFAVTALFREVPIPVIRRHTNIIAKNRSRIVEGIADMVQNRWLTPDVVREHLSRFSASGYVLDYLGNKARAETVLSLLRDLMGHVVRGLDAPEVAAFLDRALKDQLRDLEIAEPLGRWLGKAIRRGDHHDVWNTLLSAVEKAVRGPEMREVARRMIVRALDEYKETGIFRGLAVGVLQWLDIVNEDELVTVFISRVEEVVREAYANPAHPLRTRIDSILLAFADNLAAARPEAVSLLDQLRTALVEGADAREIIGRALRRLRKTVEEELNKPDSELNRLTERILRERLESFRADATAQEKVDTWVRNVALEIYEKRHATVGEMVRGSLDKLSDFHLVAQIEEKVGRDLQYIRLNGAVVGGLVGAILALVKLFG